MRRNGIAILLLLPTLTVGCTATVVHRKLTDADDDNETGIRYMGASPYLIAYSDGKGGVVTQIQYLPDPGKKMAARPESTWADVDVTLTFDRGVLTQTSETLDATAVPNAIAKAVEAFAPSLLALLNEAQKQQEYLIPAPYIYKIVVTGEHVHFLGGKGDADVRITLLPQTAKEK